MRQVIKKDVTEALTFRPSEGPPTSGTVTLQDSEGTAFRSDVVATPPAVDTTVAAEASAGAHSVRLADASAIKPGMDLWFGSAKDARDNKIIEEIETATHTVKFRTPLEFTQPLNATVKSGELSVTLLAGEVDEELENALVFWTYVVDGLTFYGRQVWDVALYKFYLTMPPHRLRRYVASQLLEQSGQTIPELYGQVQWIVEQRLRYHGVDPGWVFDLAEFERVLGLGVRRLLLAEEVQYAAQRLSLHRDFAVPEFEEEWQILMKNRLRWLDRDKNAKVSEDELTELGSGNPVDYPDFSGTRLP